MHMIITAVIAAATAASPTVDLDALEREVVQFAGYQIGETGGPIRAIDRRLRLVQCPEPTMLSWHGKRRSSVLVECPIPNGWRLFVPIRQGQGQIEKAQPMINAGERVTVEVAGDGFSVSRKGQALESGQAGEWIKVRLGDRKSEPVYVRVERPGKGVID